MLLSTLLDQTLDLLEHPEFKSFGALQKSRFQHSKPQEDRDMRKELYKGTVLHPRIKERAAKTRAAKSEATLKAEHAKASKTRANWYKDPKNKAAFLERLKKRDAAKLKAKMAAGLPIEKKKTTKKYKKRAKKA